MYLLILVIKLLAGLLVGLLGWLLLARTVRSFMPGPVPLFVARFLDNPLRRRLQPPDQVLDWVGVAAGMQVLEVGPGPGTYTLEAAKRLEPQGRLVALDIQSELIERLDRKLEQHGITNVGTCVGSADDLPFPPHSFDVVFMVTVLGEISDKAKTLQEIQRVLKTDGRLAVSEFLLDPDYVPLPKVVSWCEEAGLKPGQICGGLLYYVATFG